MSEHPETVDSVESDDTSVERALRVGLEDFELDEADRSLLERSGADLDDEQEAGPLPVVAIIGRPNVGKSTLVNRIIGRREAVVEDVPGVTRDRVAYDAEWSGRRFTLVDTGGWEVDARGIHLRVAEQAEVAIDLADVVMFVVDATVGATDTDESVVRLLRRSGKPVILVANKVDDARAEADAAMLWSSGSASRGRCRRCTAAAAATSSTPSWTCCPGLRRRWRLRPRAAPAASPSSAGPNVGKSSLLNMLAGRGPRRRRPRRRHDPRPGRRDDRARRQDLALRRHRRHPPPRAPDPGRRLLRLAAHPDRAGEGRGGRRPDRRRAADRRAGHPRGAAGHRRRPRRSCVAYNKWDLLDEERRHYLEREIEKELVQVPWAPRVNVSALTGRHMDRSSPPSRRRSESWDTRIPTGRLNAFLGEIVAAHPHPVRGGKQPRILFATQARRARRGSCSSPPASSRPATAGSSSAGCARSSASSARRSRSRCECARSAAK